MNNLFGSSLGEVMGLGSATMSSRNFVNSQLDAEIMREALRPYTYKPKKDKLETMKRAEPLDEIKKLEIKDEIKQTCPF